MLWDLLDRFKCHILHQYASNQELNNLFQLDVDKKIDDENMRMTMKMIDRNSDHYFLVKTINLYPDCQKLMSISSFDVIDKIIYKRALPIGYRIRTCDKRNFIGWALFLLEKAANQILNSHRKICQITKESNRKLKRK